MIGLFRHPYNGARASPSNQSLFRLIDEAFERPIERSSFNPAVDIHETDDGFEMSVELAGMKPEDINVEVHDGMLRVSGERHSEREETQGKYSRVERTYGSFSRQMALPDGVDDSMVSASMDNGVLKLNIVTPTPEEKDTAPKKIAISSSSSSV